MADALPPASLDPIGRFAVHVAGERLSIPYRIYHDDVSGQHDDWPATQRLVADCLYSLHHDGWVRERHATRIAEDLSPWVVPFVVHLVGEYVLEIIIAISERLSDIGVTDSPQQRAYGAFCAKNPEFLQLTKARVISYWNCYYREKFPVLESYAPFRLVSAFEVAAQRDNRR